MAEWFVKQLKYITIVHDKWQSEIHDNFSLLSFRANMHVNKSDYPLGKPAENDKEKLESEWNKLAVLLLPAGMIEWRQKSRPKKIPGPKINPQTIPCQIYYP